MDQIRTYVELLMMIEERPLTLAPGSVIFESGQAGQEMFVVQSGTVELRTGNRVLDVIGEGGILGEMALVDNHPRSATAVTTSDCKLVRIDEERFKLLVQRVPGFALEVMKVMAERLRRANPKEA